MVQKTPWHGPGVVVSVFSMCLRCRIVAFQLLEFPVKIVDCPNSVSWIAFFAIAWGIVSGCGGAEKIVPAQEKPALSDVPYDVVAELIGLLESAARESNGEALKRTAEDLGVHMDPRGIQALKKALLAEDNSPITKAVILEALGGYSNPDFLPILRSFENDPEKIVKDGAAAAIQRICAEPRGLKDILRRKKKRNTFVRVVFLSLQADGKKSDLAAEMFRLRLFNLAALTGDLLIWDDHCFADGNAPASMNHLPLYRLAGRVSVKEEGGRTAMRIRMVISDERDSIKGGAGARAEVSGGVYPPILRDLTSSLSESVFEDILTVVRGG